MTKDEVLMKALQMSLIELLRSVPKNARLIVDNAGGMSSMSHPVGYLCHKAAEALAQPEQEPVAWVKDNLICPENGYETTRTEEHPKDLGWTPLYTHPAPSWQGLSDDEILEIDKSIDPKIIIGKGKTLFARAIEQELKTKNGFSGLKEKNT